MGNNTLDTNNKTSTLASADETINHGLINIVGFIPTHPGYYHTSILDLPAGDIIKLAGNFDRIILFDQPVDTWDHWKPLLSTYKIMLELDSLGQHTVFKNNDNIKKFSLFYKMITENKSFCIYPWILLTEENNYVPLCTRSTHKKVTTIKELKDWRTDPEYKKIRAKMLAGEKLPDHCQQCYDYESRGIESSRMFETMDWISKLDIESIEDLENIQHPYYYEIRLSNKCNLKCRSCKPEHSHLIDKEFKKFNIVYPSEQSFAYSNFDHVDIDSLTPYTRIYIAGGEPTVIPEFYAFMEECIRRGKTDFDLTVGTNADKLSPRFLKLTDHFTNMNFSVSVDGHGLINDYSRWGSDFDTVMKNAQILKSRGHTVSFLTVPGIYNVTNLHLLFEYLDKEFPDAGMYLQINHFGLESAYNHPTSQLVIESMKRCRQTKIYYADGRSTKTTIDSLFDYYSNKPVCDIKLLKEFFEFNDKLDQARNVQLINYIPELEDARQYIMVDF